MTSIDQEKETDQKFDFMKLPNELQAEILARCDYKTMINSTKTCKHLNEVVFSELKTSGRVWFQGPLFSETVSEGPYSDGRWKAFIFGKRSYRNIKVSSFIENLNVDEELQLKIKGSAIRGMKIWSRSICLYDEIAQFLLNFDNLKKLELDLGLCRPNANQMPSNLFLPKLEILNLSHWSQVEIFSKICGLKVLKIEDFHPFFGPYYGGPNNSSISIFEKFILQQHNLQTLEINSQLPEPLFSNMLVKDLREASKVVIENITLRSIAWEEGSVKFLETQRSSLKNVKLYRGRIERSGHDPEFTAGLLEAVFTLPKLVTLEIEGPISLISVYNELKHIRNYSVKTIHSRKYVPGLQEICQLFPNLETVKIEKYDKEIILTGHSSILPKMRIRAEILQFAPSNLTENPETFAENILQMFKNNPSMCDCSREGFHQDMIFGDRTQWLENNYSLPQSFWPKLLKLPLRLNYVTSYNINFEDVDPNLYDEHPTLIIFRTTSKEKGYEFYDRCYYLQ